jgi:hypothetical protein
LTFEGCQFACHTRTGEVWSGYYANKPKKSTLDWAIANRIDLRFDAARRAAKQVVDEAEAAKRRGADIRFSLAGFHDESAFAVLPTDDMGSVKAKLDDLQIGYPNKAEEAYPASSANQPNTDPSDTDTFTAFATRVTEFKNAEPSRRPYIFLVTDGVKAFLGGKASERTVGVFPQEDCDKLKSVANVVVLYLKYLEPGEDDTVTKDILKTGRYYSVSNIYSDIEPNMRQCASDPALFAMADSSIEIHEKMTGLLDEILADAGRNGPLRLTQ